MAEKKISGKTYRVEKLPATAATSLMFRLGRIVGPSFGQLSTLSGADFIGDADEENLERREQVLTIIGNLFGRLDPTEAQGILIELCECAKVQSKGGNYEDVIFNATFDGDVMGAFLVAAYVVQVNFGDFFGGGPRGA